MFYGLALNASALPTDKTYANQRRAAEILNRVWAEQPNHPAAKQTGDSAAAHDAYRKLVALSKPVGQVRPELAEATSYLTN